MRIICKVGNPGTADAASGFLKRAPLGPLVAT